MIDGILHQPNSHLLGDVGDVGGAVQRDRITNGTFVGDALNLGTNLARQQSVIREKPTNAWERSYNASETNAPIALRKTSSIDDNKKRSDDTRNISVKNLQLIAMGGSAPESSLEVEEGNAKYRSIRELLELSERVKRERRHETQRRYRKKKVAHTVSLTNYIQELHENITALEHQLRRIAPAISTGANIWDSVNQYFDFIESVNLNNQFDFVQAAFAPDVMYNFEYGLDAIVRGWCIMHWFDDVKVELETLNKSSGNSMVATMKTTVTITQRTLTNVFPHLLNSKIGDDNSILDRLASKLLCQRIVMHGSAWFEWDDANERFERVISQNDVLTPMLRLLGNLEDVSRVFEKATLSPDFQWRSTNR